MQGWRLMMASQAFWLLVLLKYFKMNLTIKIYFTFTNVLLSIWFKAKWGLTSQCQIQYKVIFLFSFHVRYKYSICFSFAVSPERRAQHTAAKYEGLDLDSINHHDHVRMIWFLLIFYKMCNAVTLDKTDNWKQTSLNNQP